MSNRSNLCLYTEAILLASRTLEICKKYASADIDDDKHDIVFIYNHEGQYFRVYDNIQDLLVFDSAKSIASFENEDDLDAYLSGESVKSIVLNEINSPKTAIDKVVVGCWDIPQYTNSEQPTAIGAHCHIRYKDDGSESDVYISFSGGTDNDGEDIEVDGYGVPDTNIFYFADKGESEIKSLMTEGSADFIVLSYEIAYLNQSLQDKMNHEIAISDQRRSNGQLYVDVTSINGNVDDLLSATFEINKLPGTDDETQCMHLSFDGDNQAASFFKKGDSYIIRPEHNVTIRPIVLNNGAMGYELQ